MVVPSIRAAGDGHLLNTSGLGAQTARILAMAYARQVTYMGCFGNNASKEEVQVPLIRGLTVTPSLVRPRPLIADGCTSTLKMFNAVNVICMGARHQRWICGCDPNHHAVAGQCCALAPD